MSDVILMRVASDLLSTKGILKIGRKVLCHTLELPWRFNDVGVSCIPEGIYSCWKAKSPKFGDCFYIADVPHRSGILIHAGNTVQDTRGCVLVGLDTSDVGVIHSRLALQRCLSELPEKFNLQIRKVI